MTFRDRAAGLLYVVVVGAFLAICIAADAHMKEAIPGFVLGSPRVRVSNASANDKFTVHVHSVLKDILWHPVLTEDACEVGHSGGKWGRVSNLWPYPFLTASILASEHNLAEFDIVGWCLPVVLEPIRPVDVAQPQGRATAVDQLDRLHFKLTLRIANVFRVTKPNIGTLVLAKPILSFFGVLFGGFSHALEIVLSCLNAGINTGGALGEFDSGLRLELSLRDQFLVLPRGLVGTLLEYARLLDGGAGIEGCAERNNSSGQYKSLVMQSSLLPPLPKRHWLFALSVICAFLSCFLFALNVLLYDGSLSSFLFRIALSAVSAILWVTIAVFYCL